MVEARSKLAALLIACWVGGATLVAAQEATVAVQLNPEGDIGLKEAVQLTVRVDTSSRVRLRQPQFKAENLRVVSGPSQSTSVKFVNGRSSQSYSFTWILQPSKLGAARIHSGRVEIDGRSIPFDEQTLAVVENPPERAARPARDPFGRLLSNDPFFSRDPFESIFESRRQRRNRRQQQARAPEIFLRAEATPRNPYIGQQVLYTLYLFTDVNVRSVSPSKLPDFKGFWAKVIPQPEDAIPETVDHQGRPIGRVVLLQRALFPRRAGTLQLEPVEATMAAMLPDTSPFGSLLPRLGEITRTSNSLTLEVRPLPEPEPPGFQSLIGDLTLNATLEPRELEVGAAATLTLQLTGKGHIQGLQPPTLPEVPGLKIFPPQQQSSENVRRTNVYGTRTWSYVLIPEKPGELIIPSIEMLYFDPRRGDFDQLDTGPLSLTARGTTRATQDAGGLVELHPIRTSQLPSTGTAADNTWRLPQHLLLAVPLLLSLLLLAGGERLGPSSETGRGGRTGRRAAQRRLLDDLEQSLHEDRPRQAAAMIEDAWRRYLEERWQIPPGTASTQWQQSLAEKGIRADGAAELVKLADDLHYLRYAPKLSSTDDLKVELVERSKKLVRNLK